MNHELPSLCPSLAALIFEKARSQPKLTAIIDASGRSYCYGDLKDIVQSWASSTHTLGLDSSSRIAVVLPQGAQLGLIFLAVAATGTFVPLNPDYTEEDFVYYLRRMRVTALVTDEGSFWPAIGAANQLSIPVLRVRIDEISVSVSADGQAVAASDIRSAQEYQGAEDVALLLHTSGSTAEPKIVPLTQRQILCSARNVVSSLALTDRDRCLNAMPLFHVGALIDLILGPLLAGGSTVITSDATGTTFKSALEDFQPTWYQGVPTMLQNIVNSGSAGKTSSLRFIRSVSAPLPEKLFHDVEAALGVPVIEIYGMTEASGLICSNPLPPATRKVGSVGLPIDHEVLVFDETGNSAAPFDSGEILVRGESVISAYESDDGLNKQQFSAGWLRTGDLGFIDDEGYLFITGRLKELINRGGEKISPGEVDRCLALHPCVRESGAFPVPHPTLGEDVNAAVVLTAAGGVTEAELLAFLKGKIAEFKIPRRLYILDSLPKNASGKLVRSKLPECCPGSGLDRSADTFIEPDTELSIVLADMWKKVLGIRRVGLQDNFFELGGDSLKATTFLFELQSRLGDDIVIPSLYESPTIRAVENDILDNSGKTPEDLMASIAGLSPEIYLDVYRAMSAVKGKRRSPESLIVGANTLGSRPPIFFSTGMNRRLLRKLFGNDQPIYWMRSLLNLQCRSTANTLELASYYVKEVLEIQPNGPLIIGGFCEGAKIAFEVAREIRSTGRDIPLLFMMEQFVPRRYDGRVAMFFAERSQFYPYRYFQSPDQGWQKYYRGEVAVTIYPWEHLAFLDRTFLAEFVEKLQRDIPEALEGVPLSGNIRLEEPHTGLQIFNDEDRLLEVNVKCPRVKEVNSSFELEIEITNRSQTRWLEYDEGGLFLAARWIDWENRKSEIRGRAILKSNLEPGESTTMKLDLRTPSSERFWVLDIDMVEEDVCFFQDVTYQSFRRRIFVGRFHQFIYQSARSLFDGVK